MSGELESDSSVLDESFLFADVLRSVQDWGQVAGGPHVHDGRSAGRFNVANDHVGLGLDRGRN